MKLELLFIFSIIILINNKSNSSRNELMSFSLLYTVNNSTSNDAEYYKKYNISANIPRKFMSIHPLEMYPQIRKNEHLYKHSKTSLAADCYKLIPEYSIILGLMEEYKSYLNFLMRVACGDDYGYHDGTGCGDANYLANTLLKDRIKLLRNERNKKLRECFKLELELISLNYIYFQEGDYVWKNGKKIADYDMTEIERSFIRKIITEYEKLLSIRLISYELYCVSKSNSKELIDCKRLESEGNTLSKVLKYISSEYLEKRLDLNKFENLFFIF